ncbi:MAG TPA: tetratricopeptide repeat protein [Gemmatimonadales bacterium]|nr:tetratricopeptide repeat protein [Gemmatimonadales bacterium]
MIEPTEPPADTLLPTLRALLSAGRFSEALEQHRRVVDAPGARRPEAQLLAATAAMRIGDLETAERLATLAREQFTQRADSDGRMRTANLLGALHFERGELEVAERSFAEARRLARTLDDTLLGARASNNLASVAHLRGQPELALMLYREALLGYQRLGDRRGTAETYHNLGLSFRQIAAWNDAEAATTQALRHAEIVGERSLLALAIMGRAELELERGDYDVARRELARASELAAAADDELGVAEAQRLQALLALREADAETALARAERGRVTALALGSALLAAECAAAAALALQRLGRIEAAQERRTEAMAGFERLGASALATRLQAAWTDGESHRY